MERVVVIGGNRGIGLALVQAHALRGNEVVAVCRHGSSALEGSGAQVVDGIDVTQDEAVRRLAASLQGKRIDRLIVNAGVLSQESLGELDADAFARMRRQFEVNSIAPLRVVAALRPWLGQGSKLGILTSRMGSIADNGSGGYYGYRASKAAVNAIGRSLAIDLHAQGVAVVLLHPGFVRTDMTAGRGDVDPSQAAAALIARMDALTLEDSGSFLHANGSPLPW